MEANTLEPRTPATPSDASVVRLDEQRRELQGRIEALQRAGALPTAPAGDPSASVAQWTNWSNG